MSRLMQINSCKEDLWGIWSGPLCEHSKRRMLKFHETKKSVSVSATLWTLLQQVSPQPPRAVHENWEPGWPWRHKRNNPRTGERRPINGHSHNVKIRTPHAANCKSTRWRESPSASYRSSPVDGNYWFLQIWLEAGPEHSHTMNHLSI